MPMTTTELDYKIRQVYLSGAAFLNHLLDQITRAQRSIFIEMYIFAIDEFGSKIINALIEQKKSKPLMDIKIHVDGIGSWSSIDHLNQIFTENKIHFKVFNPPSIRSIFKLNRRNHRKLIIIDDSLVFTGSCNFVRNHLKEFDNWLDICVQLQAYGSSQLFFSNLFLNNWENKKSVNLLLTKSPLWLMLNRNFLERWRNLNFILNEMQRAERRVLIANAYFVPHQKIIRKLKDISRKQLVSTTLILSKRSDVFLMEWIRPYLLKTLLGIGCRVFLFDQRILHAKMLILDNIAYVGSYNLNHRSLFHDLEIQIKITEPHFVELIYRRFQEIQNQAVEVTQASFLLENKKISFVKQLLDFIKMKLALLFRFFM